MTGFFEDIRGLYYPVARIAEIGKERKVKTNAGYDALVHRVDLSGDDSVEIHASTLKVILEAPAQLIPAHPGTLLLYPGETKEDEVATSTVIAWAVGRDGHVRPVTASGVDDDVSNPNVIQHPDGSVSEPLVADYTSREGWLENHFSR